MKVKINVTQDDIENGWRCKSSRCPIALAAKRAFPKMGRIIVAYTIGVGRSRKRYLLPVRARKFVRNFDRGGKVKPFSFYVTLKEK